MASQQLTLLKIAGKSAVAVRTQFEKWQAARQATNPNEWEPEQWPAAVRDDVDASVARWREHRHEPPIVFFADYVDLWSSSPPSRFLGKYGLYEAMTDLQEVSCLPLPLSPTLAQELEDLRRNGQWNEDRLFANLTLEAVAAWSTLVDESVLIFVRRVVAGSVEDHQVTQSLECVAEWIVAP